MFFFLTTGLTSSSSCFISPVVISLISRTRLQVVELTWNKYQILSSKGAPTRHRDVIIELVSLRWVSTRHTVCIHTLIVIMSLLSFQRCSSVLIYDTFHLVSTFDLLRVMGKKVSQLIQQLATIMEKNDTPWATPSFLIEEPFLYHR